MDQIILIEYNWMRGYLVATPALERMKKNIARITSGKPGPDPHYILVDICQDEAECKEKMAKLYKELGL